MITPLVFFAKCVTRAACCTVSAGSSVVLIGMPSLFTIKIPSTPLCEFMRFTASSTSFVAMAQGGSAEGDRERRRARRHARARRSARTERRVPPEKPNRAKSGDASSTAIANRGSRPGVKSRPAAEKDQKNERITRRITGRTRRRATLTMVVHFFVTDT